MKFLLGIDIGTSGTKTLLTDSNGKVVASATGLYPLYQPQNGWAEQEPSDWWQATQTTIREVLQKAAVKPEDVAGIGLTGQMHGLVILDEQNNVLRPSIIWCDGRTTAECEEITRRVGAERLMEITANPALPGFTASKILWVRNNEPEIFAKVSKILLPKDYIRFMLTGEYATDVSDASGMQLLDIEARTWSDEVLEKLEIRREWLADVCESPDVTGTVTKDAAALTGLVPGIPVVAGGGDQAAGAVGCGIVRSGAVSATIGTSGVVFAHADVPVIDPKGRVHTFCHAVPGKWHVMAVTQAAGLSYQWFRNQLAGDVHAKAAETGEDAYEILNREAAASQPGANGLFWLPYLMGERSPHLDADARGVFFGLSAMHTRGDLARAVLEGVSYSLKDGLDIITGMGLPVTEIRVSGGGAKGQLWRNIQSEVYGQSVRTLTATEGPAFGAALLAGVGAGIFPSVEAACDIGATTEAPETGDASAMAFYSKGHALYKKLYPALAQSFKELSALRAGL